MRIGPRERERERESKKRVREKKRREIQRSETERMRIQGDRNNSTAGEKQGWAEPEERNLTAHFGTETLSTCLTSQLLTVNPQLAHPSPRCRTRKPAYPSCCFVVRVCLCGLAIVVAKYTKQAWMTAAKSNLIVKGCQECVQCTTKL